VYVKGFVLVCGRMLQVVGGEGDRRRRATLPPSEALEAVGQRCEDLAEELTKLRVLGGAG